MNKQWRVGIIGCTGMVGQRFATLLADHPWFKVTALIASARSAGRTYEEAVGARWLMTTPIPENLKSMKVLDSADVETVGSLVDFVFCAVNMDKAAVRALEETYAKAEIPVVSNNSACRGLDDVPMVIPELNPEHLEVIKTQQARLGTRRGFIAVKPNCSIQSYVPALTPLRGFGVRKILACTYQAISGAGKNFTTWPEMVDNLIPYIAGEEEKSEKEPLKIWGTVENGVVVNDTTTQITTQCLRVPVTDGHMAAVFVSFDNKPTEEQMIEAWKAFSGRPQQLGLPSAPQPFLQYFEDPSRPQTKLDREAGRGMAVSIGRLRPDTQYDYKFVCLSHNTLRGAAGGAVLIAELLCAEGYMD